MATDEFALSVVPRPERATPERRTERQLRRWLASEEPAAGLEVVRLGRSLSDETPPELVYLALRALAAHRSDPAVIDYLGELAEQTGARSLASSEGARTLTRARAMLLLTTSDADNARAMVQRKALGARGLDPEGRAAARDAFWSQALGSLSLDGQSRTNAGSPPLGWASNEELARRACAERFLADLRRAKNPRAAGAERQAAVQLRTRCLTGKGLRASVRASELSELPPLGAPSEREALAGYQNARGGERASWVARVASTVGSQSAPATLLLVEKWLTEGDLELRRVAAWGLATPNARAEELGPRLALIGRAIAREEYPEVRRMLSLGAVGVMRARQETASANTRSADRALRRALAEVEPDPVASAVLATEPLLALVVHTERGEFDLELTTGLLALCP